MYIHTHTYIYIYIYIHTHTNITIHSYLKVYLIKKFRSSLLMIVFSLFPITSEIIWDLLFKTFLILTHQSFVPILF